MVVWYLGNASFPSLIDTSSPLQSEIIQLSGGHILSGEEKVILYKNVYASTKLGSEVSYSSRFSCFFVFMENCFQMQLGNAAAAYEDISSLL